MSHLHKPSPTRRWMSAIALASIASLAAACGGDDGNGGDGKQDSAAASTSAAAGADGAAGASAEAGAEGAAEGEQGGEGEQGDEPGSDAAGGEGGGNAGSSPDAPNAALGDLILGENEVEGVSLLRIPDGDLKSAYEQIQAALGSANVNPPECATLGQNPDQSAEDLARTSAMAQGSAPGGNPQAPSAVTVSITNDPKAADYDLLADVPGCETMTAEMEAGGQKLVNHATTEIQQLAAPEGVEKFGAITQKSTVEGLGPAGESETLILRGKVRGIGVSVSMVSMAGPMPPEQRSLAEQIFAKQVEKIRNA